jgi:periplasmic copper chaperone A
MRSLRRGAGLVALLLLAAACGDADEPPDTDPAASSGEQATSGTADAADGLTIRDARSRMSPMRAHVAAAYLTIENAGDADDALVRVEVSDTIVGEAEIHETYEIEDDAAEDDEGMHGGGQTDDDAADAAPMMGMREIPRIEIPAGETVVLEPGGLHVMLLEVVDDLEPGSVYELTLVFERAGPVTVTVDVYEDL